jgi:hypothetical protein
MKKMVINLKVKDKIGMNQENNNTSKETATIVKTKADKGFSPLAWVFAAPVYFYRYVISPLTGASCRYQPTCSQYALDSLKLYGAFKGGLLAIKRIGSCHPWGGSGFDPVPEKSDNQNDQ